MATVVSNTLISLWIIIIITKVDSDALSDIKLWCKKNLFIHSSIASSQSIYGGRGIFSTTEIKENVILLSIPISCCLFESTIKHNPINTSLSVANISMNEIDLLFENGFAEMSLTLYLVKLHLAEISTIEDADSHYFGPLLHELSADGEANIPLFWQSDLINFIKPTNSYQRSLNTYNHILRVIDSFNLNINKHKNLILRIFSMVASRVWSINIRNLFKKIENIHLNDYQTSFGSIPVLVPGAQLFNHHPKNDTVKLIFNKTTESIDVLTTNNISIQKEIFINYGKKKTNSILLSQYGFIIEDNPYLSAEFDLYLSKDDNNLREKQALLNGLGFAQLRFEINGLDLSSSKAFWIASLLPQHFDSHIIGLILSVQIEQGDNIGTISNKLQRIVSLNTMESVLKNSLCEKCSLLVYQMEIEMNGAQQKWIELECEINDTKHCHNLLMICKYLQDEIFLFKNSTKLYCET